MADFSAREGNMTNNIERTSNQIKQIGIIAILRGDFSVNDMQRIGKALLDGSINSMEVTLNSPSALDALPRLREYFGDEMLIGAGTVRNVDQARAASDAGAMFLVSPNMDPASVSFTQSIDLLHIPGVFSATEAQTAFSFGCRILKLFPMDALSSGPSYVRAMRAPLNDIDFIPTGGISIENIADYARAGAVAVGMGSKLVLNSEQSSQDLTARARALRDAWEQGKHG
jgi:2-dehydro-3-deoxyphosphogluconate aldolase/(4S)-4-hydroxy-2-oxoglutarate aldolase